MTLGAFPGSGGPVRLTRIVGIAAAKELIMTARKINAQEALRIGLIQKLVPDAQLESATEAICEEIKKATRHGVAAVKKIVNMTSDAGRDNALAYSDALREPMDGFTVYDQGLQAFVERKNAK